MKIEKYKQLAEYTLGVKKPELVLKRANIIMVQSKEIIKADIAIHDGYIVGIGDYMGIKEVDCDGKYISPGFIDSHLHFESTMANPDELVYYASLNGTTTFIADPHEAANVSGIDGVNYIIESTENSSGDVYIMVPSCVPAKDGEDNGVIMEIDEMMTLLNNKRVLGLGEIMDCEAVINRKKSMMAKLKLFERNPKDGHALGLKDKKLSAYIMAGVLTDHESSTYEQAISEVRNGMYVHIREGSAARNLANIVGGIIRNNADTSRFTFCTDDKHIEDIKNEGHISHNIRKAIKLGLDPIQAYSMASYNAAQCYKLDEIGMIAPGKIGNLVILNDLKNVEIDSVIYKGKFIEKRHDDRKIVVDSFSENNSNSELGGAFSKKLSKFNKLTDTIHIDWFEKSMLKLKSKEYAIKLVNEEILTKKVRVSDMKGSFYNKVAVIERHHNTGKYHTSNVYGYGIKKGAIASSVSHDSHNIVVIGDNDKDMMIAIEKIKEIKGGYVLVEDGKVFEYLPLPIMGLISDLNSSEINNRLYKMIDKAHKMGVCIGIEPFITLSFIALPVIPEIRITTNGLYDVLNDEYLY